MFDIQGRPFPRLLQREAEIRGQYPVIGNYPHPYGGRSYVLLACGHNLDAEKRDGEFGHCDRCPPPKAYEPERAARWSEEDVPPRRIVRVEPCGTGRKFKGHLECGHVTIGYLSRIKIGRVVRCVKCVK